MLETKILKRVFLLKKEGQEIRLSDPSPSLSVKDVRNFYAATYPILTTAEVSGPVVRNDELQYHFDTKLGTKG